MNRNSFFALALLLSTCIGCIIGGNAQTSELEGSWHNGCISMLQERDQVTGATKNANGSVFLYRFNSNGRYEFSGYMESTMYGCTTSLFNQITGTYKVEGDKVKLVEKTSKWEKRNTCSPQSNTEKSGELKTDTYTWRKKNDENGESLCLISADGNESCFQRQTDD